MHGCDVFLDSVWCWIADAKWNVLLGTLTTIWDSNESVSDNSCSRYSSGAVSQCLFYFSSCPARAYAVGIVLFAW